MGSSGIPHSKIGFTITPYDALIKELENYQRNFNRRYNLDLLLSPKEIRDIKTLASKFIMGTAMSFAKPGYPVDIILHRCNVITQVNTVAAASTANGASTANVMAAAPAIKLAAVPDMPVMREARKKKGKK